jgi:hypothetical protein
VSLADCPASTAIPDGLALVTVVDGCFTVVKHSVVALV